MDDTLVLVVLVYIKLILFYTSLRIVPRDLYREFHAQERNTHGGGEGRGGGGLSECG